MKIKGKYCIFDCETGLKTFKEKKAAKISYVNQKKCAEHGIAPPVIGEMVDEYSYISAVADTSYFDEKYKHKTQRAKYVYEEYRELYKKLRKVLPGRPSYDIHTKNLGYFSGKVVLIDFYP